MERNDYLNKLHSELLLIMDEIDRICRLNDLHYYLIAGSLLGAIRHKGFIPWDDDLDIVMPREDMNKFIEIAPGQLNEKFELEWHTTKSYYHYFPKVSIRNTLFQQSYIKKKYQSGIFLDIFPLDLSPEYNNSFESLKKKIRRISRLKTDHTLVEKKFSERIISVVGCCVPHFIVKKWEDSIYSSLKKKGTTHYANFGSQYKIQKQTMPVEWYGNGVYIPFEDRMYCAPTEYIKILERLYGSNYMQLPPEEKRRCHYPEKVIFDDGTELSFQKPKHIVTVTEQES